MFEKYEQKWSGTNFLDNISGEHKRNSIAALLENQKTFNDGGMRSDFRPRLLRLVSEVYKRLISWDLVSIQPMLGPTGLIYNLNDELFIESNTVTARTRMLKSVVKDDFKVDEVADDIAKQIDTEIVTNLWDSAGVVGCVNFTGKNKYENLLDTFTGMCKKNVSNWVVVNTNLFKKIPSLFSEIETVHTNDGVKGILIGYQGLSQLQSGFCYSPYVPFGFYPAFGAETKPNDERFGKYGFFHRYDKKLLNSNYFARLTVLED